VTRMDAPGAPRGSEVSALFGALDPWLDLAMDPQRAGVALGAALGRSGRPRSVAILDAKYEAGGASTVLYRLDDRLVVGIAARPGLDGKPGDARLAGLLVESLGLRAFVFPNDPALPNLASLLDPVGLAGVLTTALPACRDGGRVLRCRAVVLRYRPLRRCTLRIEAWIRASRRDIIRITLFAKVYHDARKAASVWQEMGLLADAGPVRAGRLRVAVAHAFLPEVPMVLQEPVAGTPLDALIGPLEGSATAPEPRGVRGLSATAGALAVLHTAGVAAGRERPAESDLPRMLRRAERTAAAAPQLGRRISQVAVELLRTHQQLPRVTTLVHGDCKPSQFLVGSGPAAVLDFDHCGMADPASDVGNFTASLAQLAARQQLKARGSAASVRRSGWLAELEGAFVDEYEARGGPGPGLRQRVAWHETAALLRKALRAFARSPRSPMPMALADAAAARLAAAEGAAP